jgi:hypothetical protein
VRNNPSDYPSDYHTSYDYQTLATIPGTPLRVSGVSCFMGFPSPAPPVPWAASPGTPSPALPIQKRQIALFAPVRRSERVLYFA